MIVLPLYNIQLISRGNMYFQTDVFKSLAGKAVQDEKVIILQNKYYQARNEMTADNFYKIGAVGTLSSISPDGYVTVTVTSRINVEEISINENHEIELNISRRNDEDVLDTNKEAETLAALKNDVRDLSKRFQFSNFVELLLSGISNVEELAASLSYWFKNSNEEMQNILANDSVNKRMALMEQEIVEYVEVTKVTTDANTAREQEYKDLYRESAIKKQMEYLQKELDEMHPENVTDIQRFENKIKDSGMNEDARKEAEKVLNRLKQEGHHSSETGMLYDYLDFVTGLSWKKEETRFIDLPEAEKILDEDHYGLAKVKKRIIQQIAVMNLKRKQSGSILLFVGAPGTGKTSIGKSIAKSLGRKYARVSLGGVRDEADIRGHRRTYIGAMPGRIMDAISKSGVSNPVMVLDEIDKLSQSYNGDPASALLEVLDPEQNNTFTDHYMNVPYDLSDVLFICTANSIDTIPAPLLNRMEVINFTGYTPDEKLKIARKHLLPKSMDAMGINDKQLEVSDDVINTIISDYTREAGVRGLRKRIDSLCRGAAVMIARGEDEPVKITPEQLRTELDMRPVHHDTVPESQKPGVVTGLAWTAVGGKILYIETLFTKGKGGIIITGKLGEVMKESAQIAVSLVKSMYPDKSKLFEENDLHIHVPEGAVPKDGPSAGITMTTAIASLVTGNPVKPTFAMTGEVSLRGVVSAIGGLPEKLMAAERAGVKQVFIPAENEQDLIDVAEEVKNNLEIIPVNTVDEVLAAVGIK
ncbi:ATP-dependent Lon protease [Pseudobutyrivibrio sp. ACV-2]|uniref:endopeptidase La n=1 Tax=Pseudobutyrivibrio sp. ACV-2 TaxID=1520801 RepID=UPI00089BB1E8|nr:endopeptidase La [Pseudobutyrivibrio sp. ACV-2]SEA99648.1 ATP-dependent Lon protease [Pseudobutyrivibrio sp. ACV-2]